MKSLSQRLSRLSLAGKKKLLPDVLGMDSMSAI